MSAHSHRRNVFDVSCLPAVLALFSFASGQALAQTQTAIWTGASSNWSDPTIWSTNPFFPNNGSPAGATYNANVNGSGTITLDVPITIEQLQFGGGTIAGANNLALNGTFSWSGGTMTGTGTTTLNAGAVLSNSVLLNGLIIGSPGGTTTIGDGGTLNSGPAAVWVNQVGAAFLLAGSSGLGIGSGVGSFTNNGFFQSTGDNQVVWNFSNAGTVDVPFIDRGGGVTFSGTITNLSGVTLTGGTWHVGDVGQGHQSGGSTLDFGSNDVQALGPGTAVILEGTGKFLVNSGTPIENRLTTLGVGSQLQFLNGRSFSFANPANAFTNSGTLLVSSDPAVTTVPSAVTISDGIDLSANYNPVNQTLTGGNWQVRGNATLALGSRIITVIGIGTTVELTALGGVAASFPALNNLATNNGTFRLLGGQNFTTAGVLINAGTLQIDSGTLTVAGPFANIGSAQVGAGGLISANGTTTVSQGGTLTVAAGGTLAGTDPLIINSGGTLIVQGAVNQPTVVAGVVSGNAKFGSSLNIMAGGFIRPGNSPGTIIVGGNMTLDGNYDWDLGGNDNSMAGGTFDQINVGGSTSLDPPAVNAKIGAGVDFTNQFWAKAATWPILTSAGGFSADTVLPTLSVDSSAFQSIYPQGSFTQSLQPNALNVVWNPGPVRQATWTGSQDGNWSNSSNWFSNLVPSSGAGTQLLFGATPNSSMTNDLAGTLTLNAMIFSTGSPAYTLAGNGLNFVANSAGTQPQIVTNSANGVTLNVPLTLGNNLTVSGTGNLNLAGVIGGPGSLTMSGSGTLTLGNNANTYSGGTNVFAGIVQIASDGALGTGNVTGAAPGTLSFIGTTTTAKSFAMNGGTIAVAVGQTVTFNGGPISGAFLDGSGTFATSANAGASFVNVTTSPAVAVVSNSAADQFVHFTNSGSMNVAPGVNTNGASATVNLNGFTNQGTGSVTVGAGSQINVANFQSYGTVSLTIPTDSTQTTLLTNLGSSPLGLNGGSRTFVGKPGANTFAGLDLHGQNMIVTDGLFVNNGFVSDSAGGSQVVVDYGALYKGAGQNFVPIVTQNGGKFQAGNSPGKAQFSSLTIGPGGINDFLWQINDAGPSYFFPNAPGVAGPSPNANNQVSGWGLMEVDKIADPLTGILSSGNLTWTATSQPGSQFVLNLETLLGPHTDVGTDNPGPMSDFDPDGYYWWPIIRWQGTYTGPTDGGTLTADTLIDTSQFQNTVPISRFPFEIVYDGPNHSIDLVMPIPEPSTLVLVGFSGIGLGWIARRRRAKSLTPTPSPR